MISPDGAGILFTSSRDGNNEIYGPHRGTASTTKLRHPAEDFLGSPVPTDVRFHVLAA